jgi:hypothetical protein
MIPVSEAETNCLVVVMEITISPDFAQHFSFGQLSILSIWLLEFIASLDL